MQQPTDDNRLSRCFNALQTQQRKALIAYMTAGFPEPAATVELLRTLTVAGADGPVIQRASEQALRAGTKLGVVMEIVAQFRALDAHTPLVIMSYLNPIEARGYESFAAEAAAAGVDGVLVVDLPPEAASALHASLTAHGIAMIFLVAPTTEPERLALIAQYAGGFVYCVSLKGVTGSGAIDVDAVAQQVAAVRRQTALPVGVGFAIRDPATAGLVAGYADAVIVGSALVEVVAAARGRAARQQSLQQLVAGLRGALDAVAAPGNAPAHCARS